MKKVLIGLGVLVLLGAGFAGFLYWRTSHQVQLFETTAYGDPGEHVVIIPKGTDPAGAGKFLELQKVISSADTWHLWLRWNKLAPKIKAGEYEFTGPMTPPQIVDKLVKGEVKMHKVGPIAEGLRCDEIMPILAQSDLGLDENTLTGLCVNRDFAKKVGLKGDRIEGYLFPDTYSFPRGVDEETVVAAMVKRAKDEYAKANASRSSDIKLTENEAMTLASIIEKESGIPEERPHISCLFHNRLKKKIKLQTDPTVLYGMYVLTGKFDKSLAQHGWVAARETKNDYNTYLIDALPIGPISNPGAESIRAALEPSKCNDLFFVATGHGGHVFCPDLACHEKAVQQYVAALKGQ